MTPSPLPHYQALERTGQHMVAAAQQGHWAEVTRLEGVALKQVEALRRAGTQPPTTPHEREARLNALKALLRLDAQVRRLAEPGWALMEAWLTPSRSGQVGAYLADTQGKH
ncbi:flagellar protein FliT [Tepidicella baoligensis]|uniref:flagellar protein FliT n=1 Tax=Tepidicella baoligensis TaxID=2707016 RepID=UPI0015D965DE|nr:flagellar protein FliT [Tepidicella baoligensis]